MGGPAGRPSASSSTRARRRRRRTRRPPRSPSCGARCRASAGPTPRGVERPIGIDDVLVVAPYNNQVALIRRLLPDAARVGTVDKFQGQEAPVVLYSMTSTSAEDAPRGVSFLYDLNRLNVAVSRAKALAVVVMSEELLDAPVRTPEQLRQVNALCRLVEMATVVGAAGGC